MVNSRMMTTFFIWKEGNDFQEEDRPLGAIIEELISLFQLYADGTWTIVELMINIHFIETSIVAQNDTQIILL